MDRYVSKTVRLAAGPKTQGAYELLLDEAATIRMRKVLSYGEDRYKDDSLPHAMLMTYSDIYRKFIRLKSMIMAQQLHAEDGESVRDTFMDLANYALMGVQLWDQFHGAPATQVVQPELPMDESAFSPETGIDDDIYEVGRNGKVALARLAQAWKDRAMKAEQALAANSEAPMRESLDQIAVYTEDPAEVRKRLEDIFSLDRPWSEDHVTASGSVFSDPDCTNGADLAFHYDLVQGGVEFEVLHYTYGENWLAEGRGNTGCDAGFSHIGMHVESVEPWKAKMKALGYGVAQEVVTASHTNPHIKDSRRYHYVIFDTHAQIGFDLKLIQRLPLEEPYKLMDGIDDLKPGPFDASRALTPNDTGGHPEAPGSDVRNLMATRLYGQDN